MQEIDFYSSILSRVSTPLLIDPAPCELTLKKALGAGITAPDHGKLRPWRFKIFKGEGRLVLGETFLKAALAKNTALSLDQQDRMLKMPMRAPLVLMVFAHCTEHSKVPRNEQLIAVGACVQNIQLALHAFGFGCMWRTGEMAYDTLVKKELGLTEQDEIIAFLYIGTAKERLVRKDSLDISSFIVS